MERSLTIRSAVIVALVTVLTACSSASEAPSSSPSPPTSTSASPNPPTSAPPGSAAASSQRPFAVQPQSTLREPWAMAFLPDGNLLITQRGGELLLRNQKSGEVATISGTPEVVHEGQGGLGDVVLSPRFAADRTIYLSWVEAGEGSTSGAVVGRGVLDVTKRTLTGLSVIWRQTPKVTGSGHFSHRLAFSPDGKYLFVSSGERQKFTPAQDLSNNLGKILRLNLDGRPAAGNPFASRGGVSAQIYSYGHRNVLGLAFDPAGRLWNSEMGPMGGDEVNLVLPGRNYGWPNASNGSNYDGTDIPDHRAGDGYEAPTVWWTPSISPGCLMIYTGTAFPAWTGDAFVCALSGQALIRVHLDGTTASKADQWAMGARIRAAAQAPDGTIWLLEDGTTGRLLHLTPA